MTLYVAYDTFGKPVDFFDDYFDCLQACKTNSTINKVVHIELPNDEQETYEKYRLAKSRLMYLVGKARRETNASNYSSPLQNSSH